MNQWWWWHRSLTLAYFGRNFVCFVIYLPISPQGRPRFELFYRVYLQQPVEFKIVRTENNYVSNSPVELAHCAVIWHWIITRQSRFGTAIIIPLYWMYIGYTSWDVAHQSYYNMHPKGRVNVSTHILYDVLCNTYMCYRFIPVARFVIDMKFVSH